MIMQQKVVNRPDLIKKESAFIVNVNKKEYENALSRRNLTAKKQELEDRLSRLESQVDYLLKLNSTFR